MYSKYYKDDRVGEQVILGQKTCCAFTVGKNVVADANAVYLDLSATAIIGQPKYDASRVEQK